MILRLIPILEELPEDIRLSLIPQLLPSICEVRYNREQTFRQHTDPHAATHYRSS